ncbi:MAG: hypothetical protein BWY95_01799 [Bacteroidetes bacterium ADurb.BinA104]|nr:MAG: hypothetical protein BWY95_01799 [Bacteroidetes bacterium ADurb.BinA104]
MFSEIAQADHRSQQGILHSPTEVGGRQKCLPRLFITNLLDFNLLLGDFDCWIVAERYPQGIVKTDPQDIIGAGILSTHCLS